MPRGTQSQIGDTNVSANGYHYTRTETGWRLTHHLIAEEQLGRPLEPNELVRFADRDRNNLSPENIIVTVKHTSTPKKRLAQVEARIAELEAERDELLAKLTS